MLPLNKLAKVSIDITTFDDDDSSGLVIKPFLILKLRSNCTETLADFDVNNNQL